MAWHGWVSFRLKKTICVLFFVNFPTNSREVVCLKCRKKVNHLDGITDDQYKMMKTDLSDGKPVHLNSKVARLKSLSCPRARAHTGIAQNPFAVCFSEFYYFLSVSISLYVSLALASTSTDRSMFGWMGPYVC